MKLTDLRESKIYLSNMDDRLTFQNKLFDLGIKWADGSTYVSHIDENFYYIDDKLKLGLGTKDDSGFLFTEHKYKQIFLFNVLNIDESEKTYI